MSPAGYCSGGRPVTWSCAGSVGGRWARGGGPRSGAGTEGFARLVALGWELGLCGMRAVAGAVQPCGAVLWCDWAPRTSRPGQPVWTRERAPRTRSAVFASTQIGTASRWRGAPRGHMRVASIVARWGRSAAGRRAWTSVPWPIPMPGCRLAVTPASAPVSQVLRSVEPIAAGFAGAAALRSSWTLESMRGQRCGQRLSHGGAALGCCRPPFRAGRGVSLAGTPVADKPVCVPEWSAGLGAWVRSARAGSSGRSVVDGGRGATRGR